jgi:phosphoglycolate phosphatase-like HAD superfamily hydrolase
LIPLGAVWIGYLSICAIQTYLDKVSFKFVPHVLIIGIVLAGGVYIQSQVNNLQAYQKININSSPNGPEAMELWKVIANQTSPDETVCFFKPRILSWYTRAIGKTAKTCPLPPYYKEKQLIMHLHGQKIDWFVVSYANNWSGENILELAKQGKFGEVTWFSKKFALIKVKHSRSVES